MTNLLDGSLEVRRDSKPGHRAGGASAIAVERAREAI
jgi:hypothetical protein